MIDWLKLNKSDDSKRRFEDFCYHIANELYGEKGEFIPVDDKGGGDGVEFYLILPNGDEWGWQAKFFYPDERLRPEKGRRRQIIDSLKRACEVHPHLKKWFLCTPGDLNPKERKWFKEILPKYIPDEMELKLVHWGYAKFDKKLGEPRFVGIRNYFFGELEFSIDWFLRNYKKLIDPDKFKFEEELHTETYVDTSIKDMLFDSSFLSDINKQITDLDSIYLRFNNSLDDLINLSAENEKKLKLVNSANEIKNSLNQIIDGIKEFSELLDQKKFKDINKINFHHLYYFIKEKSDNYKKLLSEYDYMDSEKLEKKFYETVNNPLKITSNFINVTYYFVKRLEDSKSINLHILGGAGMGKTHIVNHICNNRLDNGLPALIISGRKFTSDSPIDKQLRGILDIPPKYSWENFLDSLEVAADVYGTRIPLIIDGLNEATYYNAFSNIWKNYLFGLIEEIKQRKNLVLITTCRETYAKEIWGDKHPENAIFVNKFDSEDTLVAIKKYFKFYKIKANLTYSPLFQFSYPLYLRIFCEITNPDRNNEVKIYIGKKTLFEVFDEFIRLFNKRICDHLEINSRANVLESSLKKIAHYLWKNHERSIPYDELVKIVDNKPLDMVKKSESKTFAIEDEGLLIYRDMGDGKEVVLFTYDLFGGYIIAKYLIDQENLDLRNFVNSEQTIKSLFSDNYKTLHPLYDDIKRCLAALVPIKKNEFLHNLSSNKKVIISSIQALFEISPSDIDPDSVNFVKKQFKELKNRELLFNLFGYTLTYIEHPFNALCFFDLLKKLEMNDRDVSWTEYVRENIYVFEKDLENFEKTCKGQKLFSEESKTRINLFANYILWFLTSTTHSFRDGVTRALYWYGRVFPEDFFELVEKSLEINDPYVSERMVAATYGVCMAKQYDFKDNTFSEEILPIYGRKLYDLMFKENAPYSSTHILKRDYAMRTIQIALIHHPKLLTNKEIERTLCPFEDGGIREWNESEDRDDGKYRDGNYPLDGIAHDDLVSFLGHGMDKYKRPPEYKKAEANLWWRMYNLGYSLDIFGGIDKEIARYSSRGLSRLTDIYGRKYAKIATFELAGYRDDLGLLNDEWNNEYQRMTFTDIDPSFTEEISHYNLIDKDFLGDRTVSVKEWILKDDIPDLREYLVLNEINGKKGPWVLLDGYINQEDSDFNRNRYIFPRGLFVKSENEAKLLEKLEKQNLFGRWLPEVPEDYYVFFGEIPWCDTFPENDLAKLSFEINKKTVVSIEERHRLFRDGKLISKNEEKEFWDNLSNVKVMFVGPKMFKFKLVGVDAEKAIKNELKKQKLELKIENTEITKEVPEYEKIEILIPVRENNWEDQNSPIIPGRSITTPNKQIIEYLSLCNQPQKFDFYDKDGEIASMVFSYGEGWHSKQKFIYLRQDLLDSFLSNHDYKLIWAIWGAKEFYSEDNDELFKFREKNQDQNPFQEIIAYSDLKNQILSKKSDINLIKE